MDESLGTIGERAIAFFGPSTARLRNLGEWFAAEYDSLLRFAYFMTGNRTEAEDLVQDTFVRLYRADRQIEEVGFLAYARRTMVNLRRSMFRRARHEQKALRTQRESTGVPADSIDAVWSAILQLPRQQRACVALRFYEGLTDREIAETLGVTIGTIKKQMHRAITRLRETLGERSES